MNDNGQVMNEMPPLSDRDAELLSAYIDNMLDPDERAALQTRLAQDARLRSELMAMRRTVEWIRTLPTLKAPRDFTIQRGSVAVLQPAPPTTRRSFWLWATSAAAAMVVIALAFVLLLPEAPTNAPEAANVALQSTQPALPTATQADLALQNTAITGADEAVEEQELGAVDDLAGGAAEPQAAEADFDAVTSESADEPDASIETTAAGRAMSVPAGDTEGQAPPVPEAASVAQPEAEAASDMADTFTAPALSPLRLTFDTLWTLLQRLWNALILAVSS